MKDTEIFPLLSKQPDGCKNLHVTRLVIPSSQSTQLPNSSSRLSMVPFCLLKLRKERNQNARFSAEWGFSTPGPIVSGCLEKLFVVLCP